MYGIVVPLGSEEYRTATPSSFGAAAYRSGKVANPSIPKRSPVKLILDVNDGSERYGEGCPHPTV